VDSALGLAEDVADLEALRQALGLQKLTLVAHHFGALIAAGYVLAHPDRVTRLVLVSPFVPRQLFLFDLTLGGADSSRRVAYGRARAAGMPQQDPVEFCRQFWDFLLSPAKVSKTTVVTELAPAMCDAPPATLGDAERVNHVMVSDLGPWDWRDTLAAVGVPALVIQGDDDATLLASARQWAHSLGDARLLVLPGSSLFPWLASGKGPFQAAAGEFLAGGWPPAADTVPATEARSPDDQP
jgi:pimeloyl-ACP methyl ester carboxylesterase